MSPLRTADGGPIRIVLAKLGLDGHDRGLKVVAHMLRDAGAEVIYLGLRQTAGTVVAVAQQEDADLIGISMHNGGHMTLGPVMVEAARAAGLTAPVVIGGIIPPGDVEALKAAGVAVVLTPGTSEADLIAAIDTALAAHLR